MEYYCDVCLNYIKPNSKNTLFKSKPHQEFDKCKHILLYHKDFDLYDVDEAFYSYIIEHNQKVDYYLKK